MTKAFEKPLLLLDRDGTLIEEREYLGDPEEVTLLSGVVPALRRLVKAGFPMLVVTNQSGVARGLITRLQMNRVQARFKRLLNDSGIRLQGYYICPHQPSDRCGCRKPKLLLVKQGAKLIKHAWRGSISVGDRPSDIEMGQRTGGYGLLVKTGYGRQWVGKANADAEVKDFSAAADWILKSNRKDIHV